MGSDLFFKGTRISYALQVLGWSLRNWDPLKVTWRLPLVDLSRSGRDKTKKERAAKREGQLKGDHSPELQAFGRGTKIGDLELHVIGWPKRLHAIGVQEWADSLDLQCGLFGPSGLV